MTGGLQAPNSHEPLTLEQAIKRYLRYFRNEFGATERTLEDYTGVLRRFTRCFPDSLLQEWEPPAGTETLRDFIDALWGEKSGGTRGKVTSVFKSMFKYCADNDLLVGDPAAKLRRPKRRGTERRAHEPAEVHRIVAAQPLIRDRVGIQLMAMLGLRKNELRLLRFSEIDLQHKRVRITGKGGKVAYVPIVSDSLVRDIERVLITEQPPPTNFLVHPIRGVGADGTQPYEPSSLHRWWSTCLKRAGVPHFPMHELRHTAATVFLRATGDLEQARMFLRHSSVATTQIYAHLLDEDLIKGLEKTDERWKL